MPTYETRAADTVVEVRFAEPIFVIRTDRATELNREVFNAIRRIFPITANDVTVDIAPNLGQQNITYNIPSIAALVKLYPARLEFVISDTTRLSLTEGQRVFSDVITGISGLLPGFAIDAYSVVVSMHLTINGSTGRQLIDARISQELDDLGPSTGHGLAYYFGERGPRRTHTVILDGSAVIRDGLYVRQNFEFFGNRLEYPEVPQTVNDAVNRTLRALGLERAA